MVNSASLADRGIRSTSAQLSLPFDLYTALVHVIVLCALLNLLKRMSLDIYMHVHAAVQGFLACLALP